MRKCSLSLLFSAIVLAMVATVSAMEVGGKVAYYDGNRITGVLDDAAEVTQNGSMDFPMSGREMTFAYNEWGALVREESCGITDISYDRFGNPTSIEYSDRSYTENVYSASGEKLKTTHATAVPGSTVTAKSTVEYRGNVIYRDGKVDMVLFPGGYATVNGTAVTFHYYTQDYLGNNRAVINGSTGAIEQTVAYYPFGAVIADLGTNPTTGQPYKFGGKELISANGLNEYDFGARQYYPAVPVFTRIDPLCEKYYWLSPYLYCGNNPVNLVDKDGRDIWCVDETGHLIDSQSFEEFDMLIVWDKHMKPTANWIGEYGTISNKSERENIVGEKYLFFWGQSKAEFKSIFELLAGNTKVEWSLLKTDVGDGVHTDYLTTSHQETSEAGGSAVIADKVGSINVKKAIHSHPGNTPYPSGLEWNPKSPGDVQFADWVDRINGNENAKYYIYTPENKEYIPYSKYSTIFDFRDKLKKKYDK